jgi:endonuclease/exonuclease/phosphatase (EEP) superfamily protein YafD
VTISKYSIRDFVTNLVLLVFAVPAVLSVLGFGARWNWLLDLLTHFRAHYLGALAMASVVCLAARRFEPAGVFGAFAILNLWFVAPLYFGRAAGEAGGSVVRVMTVNAWYSNQQRDLVVQYVREISPDVFLVMEVDGGWAERLEALSDTYPHKVIEAHPGDGFGIALLSKLPAKQLEVQYIGAFGAPSIHAELKSRDGSSFHLIGAHLAPPMNSRLVELRNGQLVEHGKRVSALDGPVVMLGDFNTTSWSPCYRDFLAATGLRDSRRGFGNQPSWPSQLNQLGVAIDHVLVSQEIGVQRRFIGSDVGSDHRPVIADLIMPTVRTD